MATLTEHGLSVAASRITTGNHRLYLELERAPAKSFRVGSAVRAPKRLAENAAYSRMLGEDAASSCPKRRHRLSR
ncbi:MAG: hypothetical protein ACP5MD_04790 [Verrucomicrobiia bacterium]